MMRILSAAVVVLALAVPARAQSLGELAQKEAARRKAQGATEAAPKKVYTNGDIKNPPPPPPVAADANAAQTPAAATDAKAKDEAAGKAGEAKKEEKGEEYWRNRMATAREDLRRNEMFREALQSRINALTADYSNRDDPAQRAQLGDDRQKALAELNRVTQEIETGKKAIADLEEEARRAGVPPGWVR